MSRRDSPLYVDGGDHTNSITPQYRSPEQSLRAIRKRIQDAAARQEKLSSSREELLVKREKVRASSKKVQAKRTEAGNAEAAFMNFVRDFMHRIPDLPAQMVDLYNKVESTRNDLGALEADHQQIERTLNGADWMFMEDENEFYQYGLPEIFEDVVGDYAQEVHTTTTSPAVLVHLRPPPPPPPLVSENRLYSDRFDSAGGQLVHLPPLPLPPPPPQALVALRPVFATNVVPSSTTPVVPASDPLGAMRQNRQSDEHGTIELDGLGRQFGPLSQVDVNPNSLGTSDAAITLPKDPLTSKLGSPFRFRTSTATHPEGLSSITCSEVETERTQGEDNTFYTDRRCSEPTKLKDIGLDVPQPPERSLSENAKFDVHSGRAAKTRIREWIFTLLKHNPMQRFLYQNILEDTLQDYGFQYPKNEKWGPPARQYWNRDSCSSFETDPYDKSTATPGTTHDERFVEESKILPSGLSQGPSLRTNPAAERPKPRALSLDTGRDLKNQSIKFPNLQQTKPTISCTNSYVEFGNSPEIIALPQSPTSQASGCEDNQAEDRSVDPSNAPLPRSQSAAAN